MIAGTKRARQNNGGAGLEWLVKSPACLLSEAPPDGLTPVSEFDFSHREKTCARNSRTNRLTDG